jgi:hypothetical protein
MPVVFQLRDPETLAMIIDTTHRLGTVLGIIDVGSGNQSGSVTDPGLADGEPFPPVLFGGNSLIDPAVTISGITLSWAKNDAYAANWIGRILYGVR